MIRPVVVDTGPLVAALRASDEHHAACAQALREIEKPLLTCWPVITEAAWLLRNEPGGVHALFEILSGEALKLVELEQAAVAWVGEFMQRYASIHAQVADAAVMYLAESLGAKAILTLDRRDFGVYRLSDGRSLMILPEAV